MLDFSFEQFFDRKGVADALDRASVKGLSKYGAYVRTNARRRIRKRKKPSEPGQAPSSHTGLLRNFIFFFYDPQTKSVVAGPKLLGKKQRTSVPATRLLEFGGTATQLYRKGKTVEYAKRPYMGPAELEERPKFASLFANSFYK